MSLTENSSQSSQQELTPSPLSLWPRANTNQRVPRSRSCRRLTDYFYTRTTSQVQWTEIRKPQHPGIPLPPVTRSSHSTRPSRGAVQDKALSICLTAPAWACGRRIRFCCYKLYRNPRENTHQVSLTACPPECTHTMRLSGTCPKSGNASRNAAVSCRRTLRKSQPCCDGSAPEGLDPVCSYSSSCAFSDQHFHDPPVQLRERPPGLVHLREPGQLRAELDQPATADSAPGAAGPQVLRALPGAERPALAGKTWSTIGVISSPTNTSGSSVR